ncbi:hypothetical protein A2U01_0119428, partial [Trifolium medium]|nr:hypothetical protein [Trifolium medium]
HIHFQWNPGDHQQFSPYCQPLSIHAPGE